MSSDKKRFDKVLSVVRRSQAVGESLRTSLHRACGGLSRHVSLSSAQLITFVAGLSLLAYPVAAQGNGGGIANTIICDSNLGTGLSALFTLITIALVLTGVWRGVNGVRKMSDPRPQKKQDGREEAKGGGIAFAGALALGVSPQILQTLGLTVFNCINFAGL